jgi:hypothetical protein
VKGFRAALVALSALMCAEACGQDSVGVPRSDGTVPARCDPPPKVDMPRWFPADLPLPAGAYAAEELETTTSLEAAVFVVPGRLPVLVAFVRDRWPEAGYELGRGQAGPGEFENSFSRPPAFGRIKANSVPCEPGYSTLVIQYAPRGAGIEVPQG